jgi:S1/P1 Nuclease
LLARLFSIVATSQYDLVTRIAGIAAVTIAALASPACAWNGLGHKVVAEIAWQQLDNPMRQDIVDTLARHPRFAEDFVKKMPEDVATADKSVQDHLVFQQAATWPDIARKTDYDRPHWHYIDIPLFDGGERPVKFNLLTGFPTKTEQADYNVDQAAKTCLATLKDSTSAPERAIAYAWLMHLVGDMHQPLHSTALVCDYFPEGDEGGNKVLVVQGHNLHSLWDGLLGTRATMRDVARVTAELKQNGDLWKVDTKPSIDGWIAESHFAAISVVYDSAILEAVREAKPGEKLVPISLSEDYLKTAGQVARQRVVAARLRLGAMLNSPSR